MISKEQTLHKAELQFSPLKELVARAIREGWRADELERASFAELLERGFNWVTAFVAAQGDGNKGMQVEHPGKTLDRLPHPHQRGKGEAMGV